MFIRFLIPRTRDRRWYHRLIPKGLPPPPPDEGNHFPVNFENAEPKFDASAAALYAVIGNPDASGINNTPK